MSRPKRLPTGLNRITAHDDKQITNQDCQESRTVIGALLFFDTPVLGHRYTKSRIQHCTHAYCRIYWLTKITDSHFIEVFNKCWFAKVTKFIVNHPVLLNI